MGMQAQMAQITVKIVAQCRFFAFIKESAPAMPNSGRYPPMEDHFAVLEENKLGRAGASGIMKKLWMIRQMRTESLYAIKLFPYRCSDTREFARIANAEGSRIKHASSTPRTDSIARYKNFFGVARKSFEKQRTMKYRIKKTT